MLSRAKDGKFFLEIQDLFLKITLKKLEIIKEQKSKQKYYEY